MPPNDPAYYNAQEIFLFIVIVRYKNKYNTNNLKTNKNLRVLYAMLTAERLLISLSSSQNTDLKCKINLLEGGIFISLSEKIE